MTCKNLEIPRKTTKNYEIVFTKDGANEDITGWTIYFMAKEKMDDPDTSAVIDKEVTIHTDPTNGETIIELTSSDTDISCGNYYYSIDYLDDEGNEGILVWGKLKISKKVRD